MPRHTTKTIKSWGAESSVIVLVRAREYVGLGQEEEEQEKKPLKLDFEREKMCSKVVEENRKRE